MQVINLYLYVKYHSSKVLFIHFAIVNQLPSYSISGKLAANGLNNKFPEFCLN